MVDYGGEPEVSDDGVVIYTFKALRKTAVGAGAEDFQYLVLEDRPGVDHVRMLEFLAQAGEQPLDGGGTT